jgi:glyceraldehyde 3-phosphate dehydrogenase
MPTQSQTIGINGFGRIGRKIVRLAARSENLRVGAINDLGDIHMMAHLLKYDSVHGTLDVPVHVEGQTLVVGPHKIAVSAQKDPSQIQWGSHGVWAVHECTGVFTDKEKAKAHLSGGAKKVVISAPSKDPDITICMGVNEKSYSSEAHTIVSNASCTTNCLAPLVKVLDEQFGVVRGTMLTVHSYTNDQRILDVNHKDLRRARAAAVSQIPTSTGAAKAVGLVLPHLKGKIDGWAVRVPTPNVSMVDFTGELKKSVTKEAINAAFEAAAKGPLKGILAYSTLPLVSVDYNGSTASSTIDAELTTVMNAESGGSLVKVVSWYDNESGFSQRMLDLTQWMARA